MNGGDTFGPYELEDMKGPIVWIIDDDLISRFATTYKLERTSENCHVIGHTSAFDGLGSLEGCLHGNGRLPDILLLDLDMPGMDGWCFLRELEKMDGTAKEIHVYILSAFTSSKDRDRARENTLIKGFFDKPLSAANVEHILDRRRT